jgi:NADH dehydrogenase
VRRQWLTFVIAGGGFAGAETAGAVNDFVRETAKFYPEIGQEEIRTVVIHPGDYLLPELGEELGRYAEKKLRRRNVEVIKDARVSNYDGWVVTLDTGMSLPAATLIWTAGVKPTAIVESLPCDKVKGRIHVNEYLQVPACMGVWAVGDCAAVSDGGGDTFFPPTAQHGMREAIVAARNIERTVLGKPLQVFPISHRGDARQHRTPHRCGEHLRVQVLGDSSVVDVAQCLSSEAAAPGEKTPGCDSMDARSPVRPRHRTNGHLARCG